MVDKKSSETEKELIVDELELEEDIFFSKLAEERLKEVKYWIKHEDFWNISVIARKN
ncbi:MAG TPA: hypothetical protein LFW21_02420 [Rickettsia endosymbiont of Pyrocoelia pectoralis]|nr:hypothetical protein [Rickettsia endosymbiont of Pyrocoelia pectoralis]